MKPRLITTTALEVHPLRVRSGNGARVRLDARPDPASPALERLREPSFFVLAQPAQARCG